jgi:hypothetical protein|tara:strand:- start:1393 stop:1623 length:231 start_codon:yes stop_codon:yes gene_type:complete
VRAGAADGTPTIRSAAEFFDLIHEREREEREEREGLKGFAFDHQQRTKTKGDESERNRDRGAEQCAADNKRKGEAC